MLELVSKVGFDVLTNLLQIAISSILSLFAYCNLNGRVKEDKTGFVYELMLISAVSFTGILLPLNTFAMLPLLFVLLKLGFRNYIALPLIFSNIVFNMLVPFKDITFIWRTGFKRPLAAFMLGVIAGLILRGLTHRKEIFKMRQISIMPDQHFNIKSIVSYLHQNINITGAWLILGALANAIFVKYIIYNLTSQAFSNPYTSFLPFFFTRYNVVHPCFLLAINIVYSLLNLTNLSAVLVILKPKSFVLYICYYAVWSILLATSMFFR